MKMTIGMAVYDDYDGVVFTCQALALYHDLRDCEIIIVDNNPRSPQGIYTAGYAQSVSARREGLVRYIPMPEAVGTTQPRNRVFAEAHGEIVVCLDPHVLLAPGALSRLLRWYQDHPKSQDILSGPLLYDDLHRCETHFEPVWNVDTITEANNQIRKRYSEMWGRWGSDPRGQHPDADSFEIWGQGLGLFTCRKSAWLKFNEHFREFGGEEGYIHEKFRQAGHRALCLPFLRWWHRFGRPAGVPYPLTRWNKVRNYVLGHQELGLELDPIREHFVDSGLISQREWKHLLIDPIKHDKPPAANDFASLDEAFEHFKGIKRDLNEHADRLRVLAKGKTIFAITKRQEWDVFLLAGGPSKLVSINSELMVNAALRIALMSLGGDGYLTNPNLTLRELELDPTGCDLIHHALRMGFVIPPGENFDMIILDHVHNADVLSKQLAEIQDAPHVIEATSQNGNITTFITQKRNPIAKRILIRSTGSFGETAEHGGPGMFYAMRKFLEEHPQWFVAEHTDVQYGYTILSCVPEERPAKPIHAWPPGYGPGTELKNMLDSIGVIEKPACDCTGKRNQMDRWGVDGCRANLPLILQWMREGSTRWGWAEKLAAAANAVATGLAFQINWLDPYPDFIQEAILRAEALEHGSTH